MSSERARQYHSITIGEKNTWDDWHLIPSSRPVVNPPSVNEKFIDIPGRSGQLDLTESVFGRTVYGNSTGSWEFRVMNDYWPWAVAYSTIMNYLHGQRYECSLDDEPEQKFVGRLKVNEWKSDKNWSTIVIDYSLDPSWCLQGGD